MREFYRDLLSNCGFVTLVAKSGHDALRLLTAWEDEVAVVVSDCAMPNMNGASLAAQIRRRHPSVVRRN